MGLEFRLVDIPVTENDLVKVINGLTVGTGGNAAIDKLVVIQVLVRQVDYRCITEQEPAMAIGRSASRTAARACSMAALSFAFSRSTPIFFNCS